jgi:hypothetical protein
LRMYVLVYSAVAAPLYEFCSPFILVQPVASLSARALFLVYVVSEYCKRKGLILWSHVV